MPQFGFRTGIFQTPIEQTALELARIGYDCLELCLEAPDVRPETLDRARCAQIRQALDAAGIGLASLSYHGDREPPDQRRANQARAVRAAPWLGAAIVVLNAERAANPASPRGEQWAAHVTHLGELCRLAEDAGVTLALEPEPLLVVGSSRDAIEVMEAVGSPQLKVNLDVGHAQITDDDPAASIRRLGAAVVHLHLEDIQGRVHRHLPFGRGDMDLDAIRQALLEVGYAGPYVADLFGLDQSPADVASEALAGLRRYFTGEHSHAHE